MVKPIVIGLTGGIGTGKSTVLRHLVALGAEGIDADQVARAVVAPDGPAYGDVMAAFGREVVAADGQIDRQRLGQAVFADPDALARLEGIVHPAVGRAIAAQVQASTAPMVVIEAIKLLEAGLSRTLCDQVWVTVCSEEAQIARLAASRGMSAAEVDRRRTMQMPPDEMAAQADQVFDTSGTIAETSTQVLAAWAELGLPFRPAEIRPATAEDAEGIAAIWSAIVHEGGVSVVDRAFTASEVRAYFEGLPPRARLTVATVAGIVVGFQELDLYSIHTGAMDHVGVLGTFVLAPLRGTGLGRAMSQVTFAYARQAGFTKLIITVRADNRRAVAFYTALGFQPSGRLTRQAFVDGRYVDALLFELFL